MPVSYPALLSYGVWLLARQLGQMFPSDGRPAWMLSLAELALDDTLARARVLVGDAAPLIPEPGEAIPLTSIFSFVCYDDDERTPARPYSLPLRRLSAHLDSDETLAPRQLWEQFWNDLLRIPAGWGLFDTAAALLMRDGWYVAGNLQTEGVSVYEQFKAVAALGCTLDAASDEVLLVEGDLSGIQDMLFTISSQGAAKALRGRSFYLQLLLDAAVRALLRELNLPSTCVIFNAGGNVMLLARRSDESQLIELRRVINRLLLDLHGGELALALAWTPVDARDLADAAFSEHTLRLADLLAREKFRPFAVVIPDRSDQVVGLTGSGGSHFCSVCHKDLPGEPRTDDRPDRCDLCDSYGERRENLPREAPPRYGLARLLADADEWQGAASLLVTDLGGMAGTVPVAAPLPWDRALELFGFHYAIGGLVPDGMRAWRYRLNSAQPLPSEPLRADVVYSFRFLANTTPRIGAQEDLAALEAVLAKKERQEDRAIEVGFIRPTTLFARWDSTGIERYGVLRMDVDSLGELLRSRLTNSNMLRVSAFSAALGLFFEGWLGPACRRAAEEWQAALPQSVKDPTLARRSKLPYVIYSGGDDLLLVGPWDVLPVVARTVRRDLESYVLRGRVEPAAPDRPSPITMSAGIFAETALFPMYQAADLAGKTLRRAKQRKGWRTRRGVQVWETVKDGVTFLGVTIGWQELADAQALALRLAQLITGGDSAGDASQAPRALLQLLGEVAELYQAAGGETARGRPVYGRWMPLLVYGLHRMAERVPSEAQSLRDAIRNLAGETLDLRRPADAARWPSLSFLHLSVRWAELLIRKEADS